MTRSMGGWGNDWLYGGAGNDTYHFGRSAGADVLSDGDATAGNTDTILLDPDISPDAVALDRQGYDLILTIDQSPTQLTVQNYFRDTIFDGGAPRLRLLHRRTHRLWRWHGLGQASDGPAQYRWPSRRPGWQRRG